MSVFPAVRLRRLRRSEALRSMVRETTLSPRDFIYPYFVVHGRGVRNEVESMPGVYQVSVDVLAEEHTIDGLVEALVAWAGRRDRRGWVGGRSEDPPATPRSALVPDPRPRAAPSSPTPTEVVP